MANRGALNWNPSSKTTYTVPAGYYSGGTLNSTNAYNAGVTDADARANTNSTNYKTGYNAGLAAGGIQWQNKTWQQKSLSADFSGSVSISVTSGKTYMIYAGTLGWREANVSFTSGGTVLTSIGNFFNYTGPGEGDEFTHAMVFVVKATSNTLTLTFTNSATSYCESALYYMQLD